MFCARPKLGYLAYWGSEPMVRGVLHLFVERVVNLETVTNFHDQASILAVEVIHVTSLKELFHRYPRLFTRFHIHLHHATSEIARPHAIPMRMTWIKQILVG